MQEFLNKLSSYNLFNYLMPGVIFSVLADMITKYQFIYPDIIIGLFLYYFIGMIISRVGSLFLEPIFKFLKIVKFEDYENYLSALENNERLSTLSEVNNTYRTFSALFLLLILLKLYEFTEIKFPILEYYKVLVIVVLLLITFIFSYRKQTEYIRKKLNVAVLTIPEFDATQIDLETVTFGPDRATAVSQRIRDADGDGDVDAIFTFLKSETGVQCPGGIVSFHGETFSDTHVRGETLLRIRQCN